MHVLHLAHVAKASCMPSLYAERADSLAACAQIELSQLSYETVACPADFYLPAKGKWDCLKISVTANNQGTAAAVVLQRAESLTLG